MTEASQCIHTLIYPFSGPATNHCPENGLSHLRKMECPNVYIISPQFFTHCSFMFFLDDAALCPVVGHSRPTVVASCTVCSGVFHHWIHHLWPQGAAPPGFNPLRRGWVYRPAPEAPRKGECRQGPRHFWNCLSCWASALRQDPP